VQHSYSNSWIVDTGASDHMTSDLNQLHNLQPLPKPVKITLPDGSLKTVTQIGQIHLSSEITIQNVLYVPDFKFNLLSVHRLLTDHKLFALFFPNQCWIQDLSTRRVMGVARGVAGLFKLLPAGKNSSLKNKDLADHAYTDISSSSASFSSSCNVPSLATLHARLGHTSMLKM